MARDCARGGKEAAQRNPLLAAGASAELNFDSPVELSNEGAPGGPFASPTTVSRPPRPGPPRSPFLVDRSHRHERCERTTNSRGGRKVSPFLLGGIWEWAGPSPRPSPGGRGGVWGRLGGTSIAAMVAAALEAIRSRPWAAPTKVHACRSGRLGEPPWPRADLRAYVCPGGCLSTVRGASLARYSLASSSLATEGGEPRRGLPAVSRTVSMVRMPITAAAIR